VGELIDLIRVLPSEIDKIEEEAIMANRDRGGFGWFLAGLGVGAAVAILYAPSPGEETREALRSKAQEGAEKANQQAKKVKEKAGDWADKSRDVLSQQKEQIRNAYEAGREVYKETTATGSSATKNL
jgi:gas vesicle protein